MKSKESLICMLLRIYPEIEASILGQIIQQVRQYDAVQHTAAPDVHGKIEDYNKIPHNPAINPDSSRIHPAQSEISADIYLWIERHLYMKDNIDAAFVMSHADVYELVRQVQAPEPVSGSLLKYYDIYLQAYYEDVQKEDSSCADAEVAGIKAVLDATGVKYGD